MYEEAVGERNGLSGELAKARLDLSSAQDNAMDLQLQIEQLNGSIGSLLVERDDLTTRNQGLQYTLSQLRDSYEDSNQSWALLQQRANDLSFRLNESTARLAESTARCATFEYLLAGAQAELGDLKQNITSTMEGLEDLTASNERLLALCTSSSEKVQAFQSAISLRGEIYRDYEWFHMGQRRWSKGTSGQRGTGFNRSEYLSLAVGPHYSDMEEDSFAEIVRIPCQDVDLLADHLYSQAASDLQRVSNILKFVQYLPYIYDAANDSYVRHPLETLVEGGGDCEDTSVLAARLLLSAGNEGYPVVLLTVDSNGDGEADHMMIGVSVAGASGDFHEVNGTRYYLCETTSTAYGVGFKPSNYSIMAVIPVG